MSSSVITCPNPACRQPLNLPADAAGKPLSCPHCGTRIGLTWNPDGTPGEPRPLGGVRWVPRMFLVPGFALLILGTAGTFVNGYVAADAAGGPEAQLKHGRRLVNDLRSFESLTAPASEAKKTGDPTPQDLFAAIAGQAARVAEQETNDAALAAVWATRVVTVHAVFTVVSVLTALGGFAILRGRWYWLAMLGCVAAALNLNAGCCVPGAIAGLWGFLMLARDDGRRYFGRG